VREVSLEIPTVPPSFNSQRYAHWRKVKRISDEWLTRSLVAIQAARIGPADRIEARAVLTFPTRRRRDEGNFRVTGMRSSGPG
jgi:hypothetical protein